MSNIQPITTPKATPALPSNILIDVVPAGTLENVRCAIRLLAATDLDGLCSEAHMGIFLMLASCDEALAYEIEKDESERAAKEREIEAAQEPTPEPELSPGEETVYQAVTALVSCLRTAPAKAEAAAALVLNQLADSTDLKTEL
jgi:hypothetical protein